MPRNLWPEDLNVTEVRSPVSILREQASFLERSTDGIVSAIVKTSDEGRIREEDAKNSFSYNFYISAETIGGYRYLLLGIFHGFDLYPVSIFLGDDIKSELGLESEDVRANSEEEFEEYLAKIFNSSKARKVVYALLSQVDKGILEYRNAPF